MKHKRNGFYSNKIPIPLKTLWGVLLLYVKKYKICLIL